MEPSYEIKTLAPVHFARSLGPSELEARSSYDRDQDELARLGKKQVLKVRDGCSALRLAGVILNRISGISHSCQCWALAVP